MKYTVASLLLFLTACTGVPKGITPVENFELNRYLGDWYEIARLDHSFERGLSRVTANYALNPDGSLKVTNRGFSEEDNVWQKALGKAYIVGDKSEGHLKVSFFGPFYGSYVIFRLDDDYQYAFITGFNRDFLWLLSRSPVIDDQLKNEFLATITELGFDSDKLIFVEQDPSS